MWATPRAAVDAVNTVIGCVLICPVQCASQTTEPWFGWNFNLASYIIPIALS